MKKSSWTEKLSVKCHVILLHIKWQCTKVIHSTVRVQKYELATARCFVSEYQAKVASQVHDQLHKLNTLFKQWNIMQYNTLIEQSKIIIHWLCLQHTNFGLFLKLKTSYISCFCITIYYNFVNYLQQWLTMVLIMM